jgi:hypothetical protein
VVRLAGAKVTVAAGFALIAAGLIAGTFTRTGTGYGFAAFWITVLGAGLGLALPTAMDAAIGELSADRSGVGSAVITAVRTVGGTLGVAVLGSVLNSACRAHLPPPGSGPAAAADAIRSSVMAAVAAAAKLGSPPLLALVRAAFVHGMDTLLWVCGGITLAGMLLALVFLPWRIATQKPAAQPPEPARAVGQPRPEHGAAA